MYRPSVIAHQKFVSRELSFGDMNGEEKCKKDRQSDNENTSGDAPLNPIKAQQTNMKRFKLEQV